MDECQCTSEFGFLNVYGSKIEAYCYQWNRLYDYEWCYLKNDSNALFCPGAERSKRGKYYWTKHEAVCKGKIIDEVVTVINHMLLNVCKEHIIIIYHTHDKNTL